MYFLTLFPKENIVYITQQLFRLSTESTGNGWIYSLNVLCSDYTKVDSSFPSKRIFRLNCSAKKRKGKTNWSWEQDRSQAILQWQGKRFKLAHTKTTWPWFPPSKDTDCEGGDQQLKRLCNVGIKIDHVSLIPSWSFMLHFRFLQLWRIKKLDVTESWMFAE